MNTIELLEELSEAATPRPWHPVVEGEEAQHWGVWGTQGAEVEMSLGHPNSPDMDLLIAAVNALPDLLKLALAAERYRQCQTDCPVRKRGEPCGDCLHAWVEFQSALEPLFREVPS